MTEMDQIKFVIEELNKPPFNQNLNLISYDNLRPDQRLDLLISILNIIDPKLNLTQLNQTGAGAVGDNIEDIVATILDQLRIFQYDPPKQFPPNEFRKNLILADKDLMTNIFEWILKRIPLLKKRSYLSRFLVKIELTPDVEGDQDVLILYRQYLNLIDEFKKIHSTYEQQKKSIDSIIELQKDIKIMELEKDQIKNKLDIIKRRVSLHNDNDNQGMMMVVDENHHQQGQLQQQQQQQLKQKQFEQVKNFILIKNENIKLQRQLEEQKEKISNLKKLIEIQKKELDDLKSIDWNKSIKSPEVILYQLKDEIDIKQKLVKDVLPNELAELRRLVKDLENVVNADSVDNDNGDGDDGHSIGIDPNIRIKDQLSKTVLQVQALQQEINDLVEKKLLDKQNEEDRLSHYRQNAQAVSKKKEEIIQKYQELEKILAEHEEQLEELRAKFQQETGESNLRGDALRLYLEKISKRELEMNEMKEELNRINSDIDELRSKLRSLKQQEKETMEEINETEQSIDLQGYFQMKELNQIEPSIISTTTTTSNLNRNKQNNRKFNDNLNDDSVHLNDDLNVDLGFHDDNILNFNNYYDNYNDDNNDQSEIIDYEQMNILIDSLQNNYEKLKNVLINEKKELKILREEFKEIETEYEMKKRLYDTAAAGLEAELSRSESELERLQMEHVRMDEELFELQAKLLSMKIEYQVLFEHQQSSSPNDSIINQLKQEIDFETDLQKQLEKQQKEWEQNEDYYKKQIEMWRDLRIIFDVKLKLLSEKLNQKQQQQEQSGKGRGRSRQDGKFQQQQNHQQSQQLVENHLVLND